MLKINKSPFIFKVSIISEPKISDSETVVLKAITHRGTQTEIHCNPDLTKEEFIDMIVNSKF